MTLEERLQGEWLCCVDDQCLEDAWLIDIRGDQCDFEGDKGTLAFVGDEARLDLGGSDRFVINRPWLLSAGEDHTDELPIVIESDRGTLQCGWMFRPALAVNREGDREKR